MTRYTRVRFLPRGPFHFGGRGVGMEHADVGLPADSLFSALCVALADHAGPDALAGLLARFASPPFRLTSLMPFAGQVCFLPYPQIAPPKTPKAQEIAHRKKFKDIVWVSESVFRGLVRGEAVPADALDDDLPVTLHGGSIWLTQTEKTALTIFEALDPETEAVRPGVLWRTAKRPRVTVDRTTSASAVWATGATYFNAAADATAGLYTVIEWLDADETLRGQVCTTFERLGEAGIGGERSSGHGRFEAQCDDLAGWDIGAVTGEYFTTLAPYHPAAAEKAVLGTGARYDIVLRRGWLSMPGFSNLRRGTVRMIGDGSVLLWPGPDPRAVLGELVDVTPADVRAAGRTVRRSGLAFPVRVAAAAMDPAAAPAAAPQKGGAP